MTLTLDIFTFMLFLTGTGIVFATNTYDTMNDLHKKLTSGRNKDVRPVLNQSDAVNVTLFFHLTYIQDFDELEGKLSIRGFFGIHWNDPTAAWNEKSTGLSSLTYTEDVFWKPTLITSNPFCESKIIFKDDSIKRIESNGDIEWYPGDSYDVTCQADVTKYPFDEHDCHFGVILSGYTKSEVNLVPLLFKTDWYVPHKIWILKKTKLYKVNNPQALFFHMQLKRRSLFYVMNFILPIVLMSFLNPLVFLLPANSGERVGFTITVLLAMAVFLTISTDNLPSTSEPQIPIICILLFTDVSFGTVMVVLVVITLRFHLREDNIPVSKFGRGFVRFCRWLRCGCCRKLEINSTNINDTGKLTMCKYVNKETLTTGEYKDRDMTLSGQTSNSSADSSITWKDVGTETDFVFCSISAVFMVTVHLLYIFNVVYNIFGQPKN